MNDHKGSLDQAAEAGQYALGQVLLAWALSPLYIWLIVVGLEEGRRFGGIDPASKQRLVLAETIRLDTLLPRYRVIVHREGQPESKFSMPALASSVREAERTGYLSVYRTAFESPGFVDAGEWRTAQPVVSLPGGLEGSARFLLGSALLAFTTSLYLWMRPYAINRRIYYISQRSGNRWLAMSAGCIGAILLGATWVLWGAAVKEGQILIGVDRSQRTKLVVESVQVESAFLIARRYFAFARGPEAGPDVRIRLKPAQFEVTRPGDRLVVVPVAHPRVDFVLLQDLPSGKAVITLGSRPLATAWLLPLVFIWSLVLATFGLLAWPAGARGSKG